MKVNITALFDITFDSTQGNSKTQISFTLPSHPKLEVTDNMKKLTVEEVAKLCNAMLDRKVFD